MAKSAENPSVGFAPVATADARILILGSLPGQKSLQSGEYYAHPRNAFWPIMKSLIGACGDYPQRCKGLTDAGVAVWDVLREASRPGSLDASIRSDSIQTNDFNDFFEQHGRISRVAFNGVMAETMFRRHVEPRLRFTIAGFLLLPSTSPANATLSLDEKADIWRSILS